MCRARGMCHDANVAAILVGVSILSLYMSANTYFAIILDTVASARVGAVGGFIHMVANFAGVLSPMLTGFIVEASGSFLGAFALAALVARGGAISVSVFVRTDAAPVWGPADRGWCDAGAKLRD